jgi:hypothetical protein
MKKPKGKTKKAPPIYFETDEIEEMINSLEQAYKAALDLTASTINWKWVTLAMHSAVQGACVCALRGADTSGVNVLEKKSREEMLDWLNLPPAKQKKKPYPKEKLASPTDLFKRVQKPLWMHGETPMIADEKIKWAFGKLCDFRNEFIHFVPKSWAIEVSGMPVIIERMCDVVEHLAVKHPSFAHHMEEPQVERLQRALACIREGVKAWAALNGISK